MDIDRFADLLRSITVSPSRRDIARALGGMALGGTFGAYGLTEAEAGERRKRQRRRKKRKPLERNSYGCVDVGGKCRGNGANCCSGICEGKKPKKGKKDKSRCLAHNVLDCPAGADGCAGQLVECGTGGIWGECFQTTGQASFCAMGGGACVVCQKDTDCEALGFGPGAACTVCPSLCSDTGGAFCLPAAV